MKRPVPNSAPTITFLSTGTCGKILTVWNVLAIPMRQIRKAGFGVMSTPLNVISAGLRLERRRNQVEQRGLAGAVGADETQNLSFVHVEVDVRHSGEAAEVLADSLTFKQVHCDLLSPSGYPPAR